ncbi:MAG: hypothetical protein GF307_03310 [candidate division Zixibacteria bacterium]|nr:hypothetical protein [candidate division Zixibacteria bacterium]
MALLLFTLSAGELVAELSHDECEEGCEETSQTCHDCVHSLIKPYMVNLEFIDEFQIFLNPTSIPSALTSFYKNLEVNEIDHPPRLTLQSS